MQRLAATMIFCLASAHAWAQNRDEVARQLSNPIASLTSVPFQFNYEEGAGATGEGHRWRLNVQPVIPMSIGEDWNLISRTIVPVVQQGRIVPGAGEQSGLGDTLQSFFFSPKALTDSGWTWGVGPVFLLPTATDDLLGGGKWGAGPTLVALRQTEDGWTYGVLTNHVHSFGGDSNRRDIDATFLQPFVAKRIGPGRTLSANIESTYDWKSSAWTAPMFVGVSQVLPVGKQLISLQGGVLWYVEAPGNAPDWGVRFTFTLLFPKH